MSKFLERTVARVLAATLVAVVAGAGAAPVSLITNGDFETGTYAGWTTSATAPSLYNVGGIYGTKTAGFGAGGFYNQFLSQVIGTRIGSTYMLSFDYGWFAGCNCGDGAQSLQVDINGIAFATIVDNTPSYSTVTSMRNFSYSFVASSTATTLAFRDRTTSGASSDGLFDNVVVTGDRPLPEPGSLALAGLALAGLAWSRRKAV